MNDIKKLVLKEWFRFFLYSIIVLLVILTISNLITGLLRGNVTSTEVLKNYFLELPSYLNKIFPVSCLVASLFSVNKLRNSNELTAIFSLGFSRKKVFLYLIEASIFVACIQFLNSAFIQPSILQKKSKLIADSGRKFRNLKSQGLRSSTIGSGKIWFKSPEYYFSFSSYNKFEDIINSITIFYFDQDSKISKIIKSKSAKYISDNTWEFEQGSILSQLSDRSFPSFKDFLIEKITLKETPNDFRTIEADITTLTLFKLYNYIKGLDSAGISTGEYKVIFLDKFSSSLICVIFTLLAAIGIFTPNRRGSSFGMNVSIVFLFTLAYWLIYSLLFEQGKSAKIDPYIASFSVPLIFCFILVYFFYKNRRLS